MRAYKTMGLPKADRRSFKPWAYDTDSAELYIPRIAAGRPRWFAAAVATKPGAPPTRLAVVAEQPQLRRWEMALVTTLHDQPLPKVALAGHGYATAVPATDNDHLAADADMLRTGILDNFATGDTHTGKELFTPTG